MKSVSFVEQHALSALEDRAIRAQHRAERLVGHDQRPPGAERLEGEHPSLGDRRIVKDREAMKEWRQQYLTNGGTPDGLNKSLRSSHPLQSIATDRRPAFLRTLTNEQREIVDQAVQWHRQYVASATPQDDEEEEDNR